MIETAVYRSSAWAVTQTAPGMSPTIINIPFAVFTASGDSSGNIQFDASGSHENGATIVSYSWDFGDGGKPVTTTSPTITHAYPRSGNYNVVMTITDSVGAQGQIDHTVAAVRVPLPVAAFTFSNSQGTTLLSVDGTNSSSSSADIVDYAWNFGDGATADGPTQVHTYGSSGSYTVTLVVTDSLGQTATNSQGVVIDGAGPTASFTKTVNNFTVTVDGSSSSGPHPIVDYAWDFGLLAVTIGAATSGSVLTYSVTATSVTGSAISSYAWSFGDGATSTSASGTHTYATSGSFGVSVIVTDSSGATGSDAVSVSTDSTNHAPSVTMTLSTNGATASASLVGSDPDGNTMTYSIAWGDGATSTGTSASHTYSTTGSYTVTATVTDSLGATGTTNGIATPTVSGSGGGGGLGGVPAFDHIIYVWMENHSAAEIYGSSSAPWINSIAAANAKFTNAQGVGHPSQPNYVAAFSGSTQGITDDNNHDFGSVTNIFSQLSAAGKSMKGYIETGSPRKHNPWESFSNTVGCEANFSTFPTTYSNLPKLSWVIPNLTDDMHDGTIAQGDTWLKNNIGPVITWAQNNNSLVIITWDEDDSSTTTNNVALIMAGQHVAKGVYSQTVNHYDVAGLIQDSLGVSRNANTVSRAAFTYPFATAPAGTLGDPGVNQTGTPGKQQTTGGMLFQNLTGSTMQAKITSAGTTGVSFTSGTFEWSNFSGSGTNGVGITFPTGIKAILGAGSANTVLRMTANSDSGHSNATSGTTGLFDTYISAPADGFVIDGVNFQGTPQGSLLYHGMQIDNPGNSTISNTTFSGFPGAGGSPPKETFGLSIHQQNAGKTFLVKNCTFDGKQVSTGTNVAAAIAGTNTSRGVITFQDCLFENTAYSAGLALWEIAAGATVNLIRPVFKNCHRNLGNEAQGGTINIYDPLMTDPTAAGEDDIRITWTNLYNEGTINIYFTAQANVDAFFANRTNKKILSQTGSRNSTEYEPSMTPYTGSKTIPSMCHVFIANVEKPLANYWTVPNN